MVFPLLSALLSAYLVNALFTFGGSAVTPIGLFMKIAFALSVTVGALSLLRIIQSPAMRLPEKAKEKTTL